MRACVLLGLLAASVVALPFEAHISAPSTRLSHDYPYEIDFSLTNTNEQPITVSLWGTPLEVTSNVLRADMFEVVTELGVEAVYTGIVMKRIPTPADFVTLKPGQTVNAKVDLLKGYWFPQKGKYFISLNSYIRVLMGGQELCQTQFANPLFFNNFTTFELTSEEILPLDVLDVSSKPSLLTQQPDNLEAVTPKANCPSNNATTIRTADTNAGTLLNTYARPYLTKACASAPVYVTWFGACDSSRYSTVTSNMNRIESRRSTGYQVDCAGSECKASVYAYVYPTDSTYTVYVCGAFWSASTNTCVADSKPGTIVHEISHFSNVAGTKDNAYGQSACQNLARTNPAAATQNADNYEYFNEACPR
jgi:peptidyl-Lys metalloendopeptidase